MKIKNYSVKILFILLLILTGKTNALANGEDVLTLKEETYSYEYIYRIYVDNTGNEIFTSIQIPTELRDKIENNKNPLIEAKKELSYLFLSLGDQKRMDELDNKWSMNYQEYHLTIDKNLQTKFEKENKEAKSWANEMLSKNGKMKLKEKMDTYQKILGERKIDNSQEQPDITVAMGKKVHLTQKIKVLTIGSVILICILVISFVYNRLKRNRR